MTDTYVYVVGKSYHMYVLPQNKQESVRKSTLIHVNFFLPSTFKSTRAGKYHKFTKCSWFLRRYDNFGKYLSVFFFYKKNKYIILKLWDTKYEFWEYIIIKKKFKLYGWHDRLS